MAPDIDPPGVLPHTPERFADVARLFEECGDPKWCWCNPDVGKGTRG